MKIYLIPGLGYNADIFSRLDLGNYETEVVEWIEPLPEENIREYAKRLIAPMPTKVPLVLIGHSFGGVMAQEIATFRSVKQIILLSSIQSRAEMPLWLKSMKPTGLYLFFNKKLSIKTIRFWGKYHDLTTTEDLDLFRKMLHQQSDTYLQWALKTLSVWEAPKIPSPTAIFQIHGTRDRTFPFSLISNPDAVIQNGSHIMLYKQPQEIDRVIRQNLSIQ